jgi:hypothetical protein
MSQIVDSIRQLVHQPREVSLYVRFFILKSKFVINIH